MPTYQYACTACDNQFEIVQKFSDDALTVCPSCQGELRKVFSAVGIVFKGSGFYRTDSRSSGSSTVSSTTSGSSNSSGSSSSAASSSGSTESKPAAAPAPAAAAS
ncbi:FmdB family zinc ribbon protein [Planomonospora sp. ID82291]|uniref:FmdB family zinc ribbon protein n=1 Tax=Planomonospora sp. ID82291 TaxID=2738136 RepID=UPI0018C383C4|nr:FmdB family zinc ribbon protein [Planomonospora sp. ID82291]MBG0814905.1 FmdB family transcriptional regulator [Planomonospora sp. ID82291]